MGSALLGTRWYKYPLPDLIEPSNFLPANFQCSTKKNAYVAWRTLCSCDAHADCFITLTPKISNTVRSAISATAGFLVHGLNESTKIE